MKSARDYGLTLLVSFIVLVLPATAQAQNQPALPSSLETRADKEAFLLKAAIVNDQAASDTRRSWRIKLDDGTRKHDAWVESSDGSDPTSQDHRFNVAAYELDKALGLNLVVPSVQRVVSGRPVSLTWGVDNFAMNELDRRRKRIDPPDLERWNKQMQAVRVFDELISNTYRDISPPLYLNSVWDNLLITSDWTIWITDHTGAFRTRQRLENPESLTRCDRALLGRLRELNRAELQRTLGKYLSAPQLDALEMRRTLLVKHFDEQIAKRGEAAVLYDLSARQ